MANPVSSAAAFGEKVPAKPPLSFQPIRFDRYATASAGVTVIPRSWLIPATEVHRSTFPVNVTRQLSARFTLMVRAVPSIALQLLPSLLDRPYWLLLLASMTWPAGRNRRLSVVGECDGPGPAPAKTTLRGVVLLPRKASATACGPALSGTVASTKAPFGEYVPAKPPLSFHATSVLSTKIPRSWL